MAHNDDENLDDFCEEALIADLLALFHDLLYFLPHPLLTLWLAIVLWGQFFVEKCLHELAYEFRLEKFIKFFLIVGTRQGQWHECELEHVILGLKRSRRDLNLSQGCFHDALLSSNGSPLWNFHSAKVDQWLQVELNLAERVLEEIKEDLGISCVVLTVRNKCLLNLHVDFTGHLR